MKKLRLISTFLQVIKILMIAGGLFGAVFMVAIENGKEVYIGNPHFKVKDALSDELSAPLKELKNDQENMPVSLKVDRVDMSIPIDTTFKILIVLAVILTVGYSYVVADIMYRIVKSIRDQHIFNNLNILRIRRLGIMIMLAPLFESIFNLTYSLWFNSRYQFKDLVIESESTLGWSFFTVGVLIYTLGYVFDQGKKLQEENELTV